VEVNGVAEVFIVRNPGPGSVSLEYFGVTIPAGESIELEEYDRAILDTQLDGYLSAGTLIRVVEGAEQTVANCCQRYHEHPFDSKPGGLRWRRGIQLTTAERTTLTGGFGATDKAKWWFNTTLNIIEYWDGAAIKSVSCDGVEYISSEGISSHSSATWVDKLTLALAAGTWLITWHFEFACDTKDKKTEVRVWDGTTEYGICQRAFTDKNTNYYDCGGGIIKITLAAPTNVKIQSQTNGGTVSIRRARLSAKRV